MIWASSFGFTSHFYSYPQADFSRVSKSCPTTKYFEITLYCSKINDLVASWLHFKHFTYQYTKSAVYLAKPLFSASHLVWRQTFRGKQCYAQSRRANLKGWKCLSTVILRTIFLSKFLRLLFQNGCFLDETLFTSPIKGSVESLCDWWKSFRNSIAL